MVAMIAMLWVLAQWNEGGASDAVDARTGTVTLALSQEPPQLDSTRGTDQVSFRILGHVMEGLLRYDANNRLVGGVAERWEVRDLSATFWLRPDARWSNGDAVTAHDFVFSWRKVLEPANASEYAFILYGIKNAEAVNRGQLPLEELGVRAEGDRVLHVDFARPVPYFDKLTAFATYNPINEAFYESTNGRYGADATDLLYNGPFTIASWVHGASLRLEKNTAYWAADRIRLNVIDHAYITTDTNATLNLFKDGKVALAGLNAENLDDAMQQRWKIKRFADGSVYYIGLNHRPDRLTSNDHLRKALQAVNDPAELVYKIIKLPGNLPAESLFPVWLEGRARLLPPRISGAGASAGRGPWPRTAALGARGARIGGTAGAHHVDRRQPHGEKAGRVLPEPVQPQAGHRREDRRADLQAAAGQDDRWRLRPGDGRLGAGLRRSDDVRRPLHVVGTRTTVAATRIRCWTRRWTSPVPAATRKRAWTRWRKCSTSSTKTR